MAKRKGVKTMAETVIQDIAARLERVNPFDVDVDSLDAQSRCAPVSNDKVESMAVSLATRGQLQPVLARVGENSKLQPVAGYTRTRAARLLREGFVVDGVEYKQPDFLLDVKVVTMTEQEAFISNFVENMERNALTAVDIALAQEKMRTNYGMRDIDIAAASRMSPAGVTRNKKILSLPQELQDAIHVREMTVAAALELAELEPEQRERYLAAYGPGVSVAQIHEEIRRETEAAAAATAQTETANAEGAASPTAPATPSNDASNDNAPTTPTTPPRNLKDVKDFWTGYLTAFAHSDTVDDGEFNLASAMLNWMNGGLSSAELTEQIYLFRLTKPGKRNAPAAATPVDAMATLPTDATPLADTPAAAQPRRRSGKGKKTG